MKILLLLTLAVYLSALKLEFYDINETHLSTKGIKYNLIAKYRVLDLDSIKKKYKFYNRKRVLSKYNYTKNGKISINNRTFSFKKMFRVNSYYYFYRVRIGAILSKECKINTHTLNKLFCKNVRFYKYKKLIKTKIRYSINFK